MSGAPILTTERLTLRPMTMADWPDYAALMMSERATYMGGPFDQTQAWGMFCHDVGQWALFGHGALMIDIDGHCAGQVGINHGPLFPEKELGWLVYPEFEGKGIAFEAATAMRDWAFGDGGLVMLVSYVDPCNDRSIALAKRLGAVLDETAPRQDPEDLVFRHSKPV